MFSNIPPLSSGSGFRQMAESQLTKPIDEARFRQLAGSQEAKPAPELPLATLAGPRVPSPAWLLTHIHSCSHGMYGCSLLHVLSMSCRMHAYKFRCGEG